MAFFDWKYAVLVICMIWILTVEDLPANPHFFIQRQTDFQSPSSNANEASTPAGSGKDELGDSLAATSTSNKTVIITVANRAYVEGEKPMLDLFLESFRRGEGTADLLNHLLIVAMDRASYRRCTSLQLHCYNLETNGLNFGEEKVYMSEDFIKMMWSRTIFLRDVLKRGYNFIFTDMDVLWFRSPFPLLTENPHLDLQISTDKYRGSPWAANHRINTGFYMVRSNDRTLALFNAWYDNKANSTGFKEQDILQLLIHQGIFQRLSIKVKFLDTLYFSGFCQVSRNPALVITVHANCCRGMGAKIEDLTRFSEDWRRYRNEVNGSFRWSAHRACMKSWKHMT